jgi:hypothetical protein
MEQSGVIDRLLLLGVLIVSPVIGLTGWWLRRRRFVCACRHGWVMATIAMPVVWLLWKVYNSLADHYGIDSVFGLFLNASIFLVVGVAVAALYNWLRDRLS